ncbi:MAG TPA: hypothetical protein VHT96_05810 [Clostridia bacterium]|nr:hypothetical protein [Clostridia bacterium]
MFEKCCICKAGTGFRGAVKSGFVSVKAAGLRKQENRGYLNNGSLWLCSDCLRREKACDVEAIENEKRIIQKQYEAECRQEKRKWRKEVDNFKCPENEPYKTVWSWLYTNIGRTAKVEATIFEGHGTTLPIITDKWRITVPDNLDPVTWSWNGEYQFVDDYSGKKHKQYLNGGYEYMTLSLYINKVNRGFQEAEVTGNTLIYRIGYATEEFRDRFDEGIINLRDPKDISEIRGWSSYSFTLIHKPSQ